MEKYYLLYAGTSYDKIRKLQNTSAVLHGFWKGNVMQSHPPTTPAFSGKAEILQRLKELIIEVNKLRIKPEGISDSANLYDDCGLDSFSVTELVVEVERVFDTSFLDQELDTGVFQDLSLFAELIEKKKTKASSAGSIQ